MSNHRCVATILRRRERAFLRPPISAAAGAATAAAVIAAVIVAAVVVTAATITASATAPTGLSVIAAPKTAPEPKLKLSDFAYALFFILPSITAAISAITSILRCASFEPFGN